MERLTHTGAVNPASNSRMEAKAVCTKGIAAQSIVKGALAGLVGGLAGAAAKAAAETLFPPGPEVRNATPLLSDRSGEDSQPSLNPAPDAAISLTVGGLTGAVYGVVVELNPGTASWQGAGFGMALNRIAHEDGAATMEWNGPATAQSFRQRYSERASHLAYGVVTELVRRMVRSRL